ncbi:MAG: IS200/IS605 family transposase [Patescibacteria group bacterium]
MPHARLELYYHVVWSTKHREPWISANLQAPLNRFLTERAVAKGCRVIAANCVEDHAHILFYMPPTERLSEIIKDLKGASSRKMSQEAIMDFGWQEGYSATTLRAGDVPAVQAYVENQQLHHGSGGRIDATLEDIPDGK